MLTQEVLQKIDWDSTFNVALVRTLERALLCLYRPLDLSKLPTRRFNGTLLEHYRHKLQPSSDVKEGRPRPSTPGAAPQLLRPQGSAG